MTGRHTRLIVLTVLAIAVVSTVVNAQLTPSDIAYLRANPEKGSALSQYNLGVHYANGNEVPQDFVEAVRWYRMAAERGRGAGVLVVAGPITA